MTEAASLSLSNAQVPNQMTQWKSYKTEDPLVNYITHHSLRLTSVQKRLLDVTLQHPWARMVGAPEVGQLLQNFIKSMKMKKIIEIGVYTGLTTMSLAMVLPEDGKIVACDVSKEFIDIGVPFWREARVEEKIDVRIQPATQTLDELLSAGEANTYDLVFIDADKENYDNYYEKSLRLLRVGGIVAIDNVLWSGSVLEENPRKAGGKEIKALNAKLKDDQRIDISMLLIGDGLTLAFKR